MPIHYSEKKAILFDVDGTIIDTFRDIHNSINLTLEEFGLPLCSKEETRILLTFKRDTEKLFKAAGIKGGTRARRSSTEEFKGIVVGLTRVIRDNGLTLAKAFQDTVNDTKPRGNIGINLTLPDAPFDVQILNRSAREASSNKSSASVTAISAQAPLHENRAAAKREEAKT